MCALTPPLIVALVLGTAVSSLTGSEVSGWIAAVLGAATVAVALRARGTGTCPVPQPHREAQRSRTP